MLTAMYERNYLIMKINMNRLEISLLFMLILLIVLSSITIYNLQEKLIWACDYILFDKWISTDSVCSNLY